MEELLPGKIRKRGCSSSASSSSSIIQNYRFKRAILVGRRGGSSTPVPTWKLMGSARTPTSALRTIESPKFGGSPNCGGVKGKFQQQQPVSARKLAATLWEMNEIPSPKLKETMAPDERRLKKEGRAKERAARSMHSGSLPPHLSDPSHSPVSEKMDRSGTGSRHRRAPSVSQRLRLTEHNIGPFDSVSNASLMEIETRSRAQTPRESTHGNKPRLKDISNALTTSKELLKIINRVWGKEDRPSSTMSLISALHAELERARLQVNHLIQEERSDRTEMAYLMNRFAEEKASWKNKERKMIESIVGELEVEKKLRKRLESLNKKLGKELAETKSSLLKAVKELEDERRAEVEVMKRESAKLCEEVEKEREMMQLADVLREERVHMKLSEAKYQLEEKNAAVDKLRSQLEAFLGPRKSKDKGRSSCGMNDEDIAAYLNKSCVVEDGGEVEDGGDFEEDLAESDLHSIELDMDTIGKSYKWSHPRKLAIDEEEDIKGRKSSSRRAPRSSTHLQRSISDGVEWSGQNDRIPIAGDGVDWDRVSEVERHLQGKGYGDEIERYESVKGLRDYLLSGSRMESGRGYGSPTRQGLQLHHRLSNAGQERPPTGARDSVSKSRLAEARGEIGNGRKTKW